MLVRVLVNGPRSTKVLAILYLLQYKLGLSESTWSCVKHIILPDATCPACMCCLVERDRALKLHLLMFFVLYSLSRV